jgi:hypothetical protein
MDSKDIFEKTFGMSVSEWIKLYEQFVKENPNVNISDFLTINKTKYKGKKRDALLVFAGYLLKSSEISSVVFDKPSN